MANNPVLGIASCPHCNWNNAVIWDGNFRFPCARCGKAFRVKRQKLLRTMPIKTKKGGSRE